MRIIHTADWHLCTRMRQVDRTGDLSARVEIVAKLCQEHKADALLIAGDLFSEQASVEHMTQALTHLYKVFAPFFARGGTIFAVAGNHDRDGRIEMLRAGMRLAAPSTDSRRFLPGRMYLLNRPYFGIFQTLAGERAQIVLIPYPTSSRYAHPGDVFRSKAEETRVLQGRVAQEIQRASKLDAFDPTVPTILVAHLHVRGSEAHSLYKLTERNDIVFEPGVLPSSWAYFGLGHIHKHQCLAGMHHVRYPGSLDRLAFTERHDEKGVVAFELGRTGLRDEPAFLPIRATPMYEVCISNLVTELPTLPGRYPDRERAIVRVQVNLMPGGPSRHEVTREIRRLFPRHVDVAWCKPGSPVGGDRSHGFAQNDDHRTTIREFLRMELACDPDRQEVLDLAERFLSREKSP